MSTRDIFDTVHATVPPTPPPWPPPFDLGCSVDQLLVICVGDTSGFEMTRNFALVVGDANLNQVDATFIGNFYVAILGFENMHAIEERRGGYGAGGLR